MPEHSIWDSSQCSTGLSSQALPSRRQPGDGITRIRSGAFGSVAGRGTPFCRINQDLLMPRSSASRALFRSWSNESQGMVSLSKQFGTSGPTKELSSSLGAESHARVCIEKCECLANPLFGSDAQPEKVLCKGVMVRCHSRGHEGAQLGRINPRESYVSDWLLTLPLPWL